VDAPAVRPALSRVGLADIGAVVRLGVDERSAQPFAARIDCMVEPARGRPAPDAARFDDVVADVLRELLAGAAAMRAEHLASELAERVRERLAAPRAEVVIAARFPEQRPAPVSGTPTQEISTLHAAAVASARGTRRMVGVSAQGITTAPHAQRVLAAEARKRLAAEGFSEPEIALVLDRVPVATHDQRGTGTLKLECPEDCAFVFDVAALLAIVEGAMSSEIFELMKRSDEGAVVDRAHRRPRTAEDCVRAMIAGAGEHLAGAPDDVLIAAAQEHFETVHRHSVVAERGGLLRDLRDEMDDGAGARPLSLRAWLDAGGR
jgi:GTP cyclohydrolase IV